MPSGLVVLSSGPSAPAGFTPTNQRIFVSTATGYLARKTNMPFARQGAAAATLGNRIYVAGGTSKLDGGPDSLSNLTQVYDPATDTWGRSANLVAYRVVPGLAAWSGTLFAVGGLDYYGPARTAEWFATNTGAWRALDQLMRYGRSGPAVAVYNATLFAFGGSSQSSPVTPGSQFNSTVEYLNLNSPSSGWYLLPNNMPTGAFAALAVVIGDLIYIIGGLTNSPNFVFSNFLFEASKGTWRSIATPAPDLVWYSGLNIGGKLYAIGGFRYQTAQPSGAIYEYQPEANTWLQLPQFISPARTNMAGAVYNNRGYVCGGGNAYATTQVYGDSEEFDSLGATYYLMKKS